MAGLAHGLQQAARAVHVDAVALVEVLFGLAGDDGRQVEDHVGPIGEQLVGLARCRQIAGEDGDRRFRGLKHLAWAQDGFARHARPKGTVATDQLAFDN